MIINKFINLEQDWNLQLDFHVFIFPPLKLAYQLLIGSSTYNHVLYGISHFITQIHILDIECRKITNPEKC